VIFIPTPAYEKHLASISNLSTENNLSTGSS